MPYKSENRPSGIYTEIERRCNLPEKLLLFSCFFLSTRNLHLKCISLPFSGDIPLHYKQMLFWKSIKDMPKQLFFNCVVSLILNYLNF